MKVFSTLVLLALAAAVANAQVATPPTPPTQPVLPAPPAVPAPAAAPAPRAASAPRAPRASNISPGFDFNVDGLRALDLDRLLSESDRLRLRLDADHYRVDAERLASEMQYRSLDFANSARIAGEQARDEARLATERFRDMDWGARFAPMADATARIATTIGSDFAYGMANAVAGAFSNNLSGAYAYAPVPLARWDNQQDQDPADSLFRVAYDAMNRGEYRRSADLFQQVQTRFPRSTRVSNAAYNEALMRYKLGTTEELRIAVRILIDKSKITTTSSSNFSNEVSVLTTRVRGALASRGDAESARILASEAQKGGCDREDMQVRAEALSALANSDMNAATPLLRRVLDKKDPCSLDLRRRALSILLRRADTAATSAAIAVARNNDETLELRVDAVRYLSRLPGDNALSTLEDLMRTSTDREVQRAAVSSLSNSENTRARTLVRTIIERADVAEELRAEALSSFSKERNTPEDAAYLRSLFPKMQSERLKESVLLAISRMGGSENDQFLLNVARNTGESSQVRSTAVSRLARSSSTISIADMSKLYDVAESRSMRMQVVNALGQRKEPEALDKVIDVFHTSTDSSVRSQITGILSRNTDPKAKKALADFAGRP